MNKMLLVAKHEYLANLKSRTFLLSAFGMPLFMSIFIFLILAITLDSVDAVAEVDTVGYVDLADIIHVDAVDDAYVAVASSTSAEAMLENGDIYAYVVIPDDYMDTGRIDVFTYGNVSESFGEDLDVFLLANLSNGVDTQFPLERIREDMTIEVEIQSMGRTLSENAVVGLFMMPMIFAIIFLVSSQISTTFLMSSVVMEKTNRIMEILITSVTPMQLMMGKIVGLGSLGLTQLVVWILVGMGIAVVGADNDILSGFAIPLDIVILSIIYFILTYFLLASVIAGVSVVVEAEQESRQIAGFFVLPFVLPFFFIVQLLAEPNGTIAVLLTLFPFSSAMTVIMRASYSPVPIEEIAISLILLSLTTVLVTWVSAKVFRWATLLYGKRPTPRELWRVIRSNQVEIGTLVQEKSR